VAESNNGCLDSVIRSVTVQPDPSAGFTVNDSEQCQASNIFTFTDQSSGNQPLSYNWSFGDGNGAFRQNPDYSYSDSGSYSVSLIVTSGQGCEDTATQLVRVNPVPQPAFSTADVCLGDSVAFTNQTQFDGDNANLAYSWALDNDDTVRAEAPKYQYQDFGDYSVDLIATDTTTGCERVATQPISVFDQPESGFTTSSICETDALTINDTSQYDGRGFVNYQYAIDGDTLNQPSPSVRNLDTGSFTVTQIITASTGCQATQDTTIAVYPAPQAAFDGPISACAGDTLGITNNTQFKGSPDSVSYTWSLGNGDTLRTSEPEYAYETGGTYTVGLTVSSEQGCSSSESLPLQVGDTVSSAFTFEKVNNETVSFNAASDEGLRYNWDFGDGTQSDSLNPTHTYDSNRKYQVSLTAFSSDGCSTTTTDSLELKFVGVDRDVSSDAVTFTAYPNPFEQAVKVQYSLIEDSEVRLAVFDTDGQRIAAPLQAKQQSPGQYTYQLNLRDAKAAGVYFLRLTIDGEVHVKRIMKAK
jgi:PKD repeat protein